MDNANKAFIMAGSVLVAVMLLTLFSYFLSSISIWPEAEDQMEETEQIAAFNAEYEVYQKSAMYGVDVISCLNKAKSNNEKYVAGDYFLGDGAYGKNYEIDVVVEITSPLTESISVTAINGNSSVYRETVIYENNKKVQDKENTDLKLEEVFDIDSSKQLTKFNESDYLKYQMSTTEYGTYATIMPAGKYKLSDSDLSNNLLVKLINHSSNARQIVKNEQNNFTYNPSATPPQYGWCTATWETYLYSFKQKRFKCESIEYSTKTGRVNKIEFKEI